MTRSGHAENRRWGPTRGTPADPRFRDRSFRNEKIIILYIGIYVMAAQPKMSINSYEKRC